MKIPFLSIIVPVYNVEPYLARCIESILTQTFTDFELILIDDESPDNSGKICDEYAQKDHRIIVIHKRNGGVSSARNQGLDIARGEYITFVDSDDQIGTTTTYEENMAILKKEPQIDVLQYPILTISEKNERSEFKVPSQYICEKRALFLNWYTGKLIRECVWNKIFKRIIFEKIRFPEGMQLAEDAFCIVDFVKIVDCFYISEHGYYCYIERGDSAMKTFTPKKWLDLFMCEFRQSQFLCTLPDVQTEYCSYFFLLYRNYLTARITNQKKVDLSKPLIFMESHLPNKKAVQLEPDVKNKIWFVLFLVFGIRFTSASYVNCVLMRLRIKDVLSQLVRAFK